MTLPPPSWMLKAYSGLNGISKSSGMHFVMKNSFSPSSLEMLIAFLSCSSLHTPVPKNLTKFTNTFRQSLIVEVSCISSGVYVRRSLRTFGSIFLLLSVNRSDVQWLETIAIKKL